MSYKVFFDKNKRDVSKRAIATKIIDMIAKIELNNTALSARRWIWELIQNARDISSDKIDISVEVTEDSVIFSHNGKPFKSTHLLSLINQVSAKDRSDSNVIGRYGTGFITTSLLSKVVEVESLIKEDNEPLKRFKITLDRSSNDISELSESIENTLLQLDKIDESPEVQHKDGDISTTFTYLLNSDSAKKVAEIGYEDFLKCIDYVLVLQPKINNIYLNGCTIHAEVVDDNTFEEINGQIYKIFKNSEVTTYLKVSDEDTSIIVPIELSNGKYLFKETLESTPRLFCEFPCIGTENFSFPVVLNNTRFFLTEPRDGVYLKNHNNPDVINNRAIIDSGVTLLLKLISFSAELSDKVYNIEKLFYLPDFIEYEWLDEEFINDIIKILKENGGDIKFIKIDDDIYSLNDVLVADFEDIESRNIAHDLVERMYPNLKSIPPEECSKYFPLKNYLEDSTFITTDALIDTVLSFKSLDELENHCAKVESEKPHQPSIYIINRLIKLASMNELDLRRILTLQIYPTFNGTFAKLNDTSDTSQLNTIIQQLMIKSSVKQNEYTLDKYILPNKFLHPNLDTSALNTKEYTVLDALRLLTDCKLTLKGALILLQLSPSKESSLYTRYSELCKVAHCLGRIDASEAVEDYSLEYLSACEESVISSILKNENYGIDITNLALNYIHKYDLQQLLRNNLQNLRLFNIKGGIVPLHTIPAKLCYYSLATKPELEELYFKFYPDMKGKFIDNRYTFIEELFQPTSLTNFSMCNSISKKVLEILKLTRIRTPGEQELLQLTYNYLQANFKEVDSEFPTLKDKVFLLCSDEVLHQNQKIIDKVRRAAKESNIPVDEYIEKMMTKDTSSNLYLRLNDPTTLYDYDIYKDDGHYSDNNSYKRAREVGELGERIAYEAIVNHYKSLFYSVSNTSTDGNTTTLFNVNDGTDTVTVKLFADNQQGYDIIISYNGKVKYYVEVKATTHDNLSNVALSQRQIAKASVCYWGDEEYILICITNVENNPKLHTITNPFAQLYNNSMHLDASIAIPSKIATYNKDLHTKLLY